MRRFALLGLFLATTLFAAEPKKIVLIAGPLDASHPAGTHEYEKTVQLFKHCLEHASNVSGLKVETHFNGWPKDQKTLDDADTIVLVSSGSDRKESDHPLLVGDRLAVIDKQMKRGCGLCLIHWSTFVPKEKAGESVLEWVGGYFDYQSGPAKNGWYSKIQTVTVKCTPGRHPINNGMVPFEAKDEFYYNLRFREKDPRLVPVLTVPMKGEGEQTVAWAVERGEPGRVPGEPGRVSAGRGFGFTGGHFFDNWKDENYRKMALNAILWTAHVPVPETGVKSEFPTGDPRWTPPAPEVGAEPWQLETDKDWIDDRFRKMDTGPYLNATIDYEGPKGKVRSYKATAIKVGDKGEATVLFDRNQLRFAAAWTGGFLNISDRRFGLLNTPTPKGQMVFSTSSLAGWADEKGNFESSHPSTAPLPKEWVKFKGLYLNGNRTVLSYTVGGAEVLESPWVDQVDGLPVFSRTFEIGKTPHRLRCLIGQAPQRPEGDVLGKAWRNGFPIGSDITHFHLVGPGSLHQDSEGRVFLAIDASDTPRHCIVRCWRFPNKPGWNVEKKDWWDNVPRIAPLVQPGPARWNKPITTQLEPGKDTGGPFIVDTLPLPYENPWGSLFFVTGVDFLPDGRIAICTAHGDVWTCKQSGTTLTWKRFATGLYQPLGLKVVDGKIIVLERGQLTRLHDLNDDGEADFYENVNNDWHTGGGEHSYDTCLETDPAGNFYFFKTGDDHTPTGGCLLRVSRDGSKSEIFCTGFRHPIGLGISPDGKISGADQEGNWMPATRLDFFKAGGFYGDMRTHHRPEPPKTYDEPYLWLPKEADNSAAGQVWVPKGQWGALGGHMLHLSYGRCKAYAILPDGDRFQGAAVDLGLTFLSGSARARFQGNDLYVVGLRGWQTAAQKDGCLQRVRYTGKPYPFPVGYHVEPDGVKLTFDEPLDAKSAGDVSHFKVSRWNYRWSGDYGSKDWSVNEPNKVGKDSVAVTAATLSDDHRSVTLKFADMKLAMQTKIEYDVKTAEGLVRKGAVYATIREWK